MSADLLDRLVIAREQNVIRVDFERRPDPPAPHFPGAGALRACVLSQLDACSTSKMTAEVA